MNFDNLMQYDLTVYTVSFDFALLRLTVLNTLRNSMSEKNKNSFIWSSEWAKLEVKREVVTYVKRKTWSKGKEIF